MNSFFDRLSYTDVAKAIDHSLLKPELDDASIEAGCKLAARYDVASVCVRPRDVETHSRISVGLNTPVILDESLCTFADLERYDGVPGRFIANLKVSRVGGVLRALLLVEGLRQRGWPIIDVTSKAVEETASEILLIVNSKER